MYQHTTTSITPEEVALGKQLATRHYRGPVLQAYFTYQTKELMDIATPVIEQYTDRTVYLHELAVNMVWVYLHVGYAFGEQSDTSLESLDVLSIHQAFLLLTEQLLLHEVYHDVAAFNEDIRFIVNYYDTVENKQQFAHDLAELGYTALLAGHLVGSRPTIMTTTIKT